MTLNTITHHAKHRDDVTLLEAPCWHSRHKRDVSVAGMGPLPLARLIDPDAVEGIFAWLYALEAPA